MNVSAILLELPKLDARERSQIFQRLCELEEQDLLRSEGPTSEERELLEKELADFQRDGNRGDRWPEVLARLTSPPGYRVGSKPAGH